MRIKARHTFYKEVVSITHVYLGPAAERFVARQVRNHLNMDIEQLQKHDLANLIDWISLAMAVLVEDEKLVNKYVADLKGLANHTRKHDSARQLA